MHWSSLLAVASFVVGVGAFVVPLVAGKHEWGGSHPDTKVLGLVADKSQRAMEQYCTGVVVTPKATWLVGRRTDVRPGDFNFLDSAVDLAALVTGSPTAREQTDPSAREMYAFGGLFGRSRETQVSFISKLNAQGKFDTVAWLPEVACLHATPDGQRVFLTTGFDRPDPPASAGKPPRQRHAVFHTDDQGLSWQWRRNGLFPDAGSIGWSLKPHFHDSRSVWAWRDDDGDDPAHPMPAAGSRAALRPSGLQHSSDGGDSTSDVMTPEPLALGVDEAERHFSGKAPWGPTDSRRGDVTRHVVQVDATHADAWVSQSFWIPLGDGSEGRKAMRLTSHASIELRNGAWEVVSVRRTPGLAIAKVFDNGDGRAIAVADVDGPGDTQVVHLWDRAERAWVPQGELPGAFAYLTRDSRLRDGWAGRNSLVVSVMSEYIPPDWLIPPEDGRKPSVSGNAVFYSTDWGRSWRRLAIPAYLGVWAWTWHTTA